MRVQIGGLLHLCHMYLRVQGSSTNPFHMDLFGRCGLIRGQPYFEGGKCISEALRSPFNNKLELTLN